LAPAKTSLEVTEIDERRFRSTPPGAKSGAEEHRGDQTDIADIAARELTFIGPATYAADQLGKCANAERGNHGPRDGCRGKDADR
jgi:hypothetical protein